MVYVFLWKKYKSILQKFRKKMKIHVLFLFVLFGLNGRNGHCFLPKIPCFLKKMKKVDVTVHIPITDLSKTDQSTIEKINGFYGLLGPRAAYKVGSLYELFLSDGMIQGMFFQNGNLTFVKHLIRTEKVKLEESIGARFVMKPFFLFFYMLLHYIGMMPNMLGVANTALLQYYNQTLALFEYDKPYLLNIDVKNATINTMKYMKDLTRFSAHSKYNDSIIETINYDSLKREIQYYQYMPMLSNHSIEEKIVVHKKHAMKTYYIPVTHDFVSLNDSIVVMDSPLMVSLDKMPPIYLDKNKTTYFYVLNKKHGYRNVYRYDQGMYLFHYSHFRESEDEIEFYGSFYDNIDFSSYGIEGKYRKVVINKRTNQVTVIKNHFLENCNLDFPMKLDENRSILVEIDKSKMVGFVILEGFEIVKRVSFREKMICGEPKVIYIEKVPYFVCFMLDTQNKSSLQLMNLNHFSTIEIPIPETKMNIGFHSIFL